MFQDLTRAAAPGSSIAAMAPGLDWHLMLESGDDSFAVTIRDGAVVNVTQGPFVMPSWQTRIVAEPAIWAEFLAPLPRPGRHDVMALLRHGVMRFDGDLHPLMANLLYVKRLFEALRGAE